MADLAISNGGLQTGPDTVDNTLNLEDKSFNLSQPNGVIELLIQVITATTGVKFSVTPIGGAIAADAYAFPAGSKLVLSLNPAIQELHVVCSNAADAYVVSS